MTDPKPPDSLTKKTTEIVLKGIAKRAVALFGLPGEVVDIVAAVVTKYLANPNDREAKASFAALQAEIQAEVSAKPERYKDGRPPSGDDVEQALIRFATAYKKAGSHHKRRILFNAFHNSFRPEFYDEGLALILWAKVEDLEYPDFDYLQKLIENKRQNPTREQRKLIVENPFTPEYEFMKRLEEKRLVSVGDMTGTGKHVFPSGLSSELAKFALEEFWKEDPKPGATP